jgi:hypothetical protein
MLYPGYSALTDYRPDCDLEQKIKKQAGITDNYTYRQYLQKNAVNLMNQNSMLLVNGKFLRDSDTTCKTCGK